MPDCKLCAQDGCHLLVCRLRIVGIKPVHAAQRTSYELAQPVVASLPSLSISSTLELIAGVSVLYAHKNAPAGAGTPTGACTEPLGGTMRVNGTRLYRVKAVAEMFDVSVSTIYRAIEAGQLQALRIGSGKGAVRVPEAALGSFEAACADAAHKAVLAAGEPGDAGRSPDMAEQRRKSAWGDTLREQVLRTAIAKRAVGVPTYSVPEAAALLSVSADHLYRLIRAGGFPAVRMRVAGGQGRYVVPAKAVDQLVGQAVAECGSVEVSEWAAGWSAATAGGVA